ncbi:MAG: ferredoxin family protein [Actinomycetota bacterium]
MTDTFSTGARIESDSTWNAIPFDEWMSTAEFRIHERAHITVNGDTCRGCTTRECVVACPANLFVPTSDGGILFNYENCFECGTCYMVCNRDGAITWTYPDGGYGIVFHRT